MWTGASGCFGPLDPDHPNPNGIAAFEGKATNLHRFRGYEVPLSRVQHMGTTFTPKEHSANLILPCSVPFLSSWATENRIEQLLNLLTARMLKQARGHKITALLVIHLTRNHWSCPLRLHWQKTSHFVELYLESGLTRFSSQWSVTSVVHIHIREGICIARFYECTMYNAL